eukprot:GHVT01090988.1.p1 GENE.GHVT01090988.1~~GHVT01090988.1.p1  ORF type:complete len:100 (-),score=0.14 GHVT01090988.1:183-482(-)
MCAFFEGWVLWAFLLIALTIYKFFYACEMKLFQPKQCFRDVFKLENYSCTSTVEEEICDAVPHVVSVSCKPRSTLDNFAHIFGGVWIANLRRVRLRPME